MNQNSKKIEENLKLALSSVDHLLDQCNQAWEESKEIVKQDQCPIFDKMLICGMGGSALPAHIIKSVLPIKVPLFIIEGYDLPNWADKNTLVILSSYSGNTEETLSCAIQAKKIGCKIMGITSGGELKKTLDMWQVPHYTFKPKHNPSGLPRFGIGYGLFGLLGMMFKCGMFDISSETDLENDIKDSIAYVSTNKEILDQTANKLTKKMKNHTVIVFASEHLEGNGKTFANQLNETSKILSFCADLPDADHNLIEGFLKDKNDVSVVMIKSAKYLNRISQRFEITNEIIQNDGYKTYSFEPSGSTKFMEMLETLYFTSIFGVLLSAVNSVDPLSIPAVEFIKGKLNKLTKTL